MKHETLTPRWGTISRQLARWARVRMLGPAMTPMADSRQLVRWARIAQMRGPAMTPMADCRSDSMFRCVFLLRDDAEADRHEERIPSWGRGYEGNTCTYLLEHAKLHD